MPVHCSSWTRARLHAQGWAWSAAWLQWDRSLAASCSVCAKHGTDAQLTLKGTVYRSGRAIAESVSVTPRLHLNFSPWLSALYLLQPSCKSSGWCPPLVPLGRFSTSKYSHTGLRFNCFMLVCFFFPSSCQHGCLCCFRAIWCRRSGLSRPCAGWRDVKSAFHFIPRIQPSERTGFNSLEVI